MKNYTITVNGTAYDVTVEEKGTSTAPAQAARAVSPAPSAPAPAPTPAPAPAPAPAAAGTQGSIRIEASASGKVFSIDTKPGDPVKRGDPVLTLEIMKMETPVVAPQDGTVASIEVKEGQQVETGLLLATMNG